MLGNFYINLFEENFNILGHTTTKGGNRERKQTSILFIIKIFTIKFILQDN
jgi:hypothetical protein